MEEEGNGVVPRGRESNSAVQVIVVIIRPPRTLQVAKRLVICPVAILEGGKTCRINVRVPVFSVLPT